MAEQNPNRLIHEKSPYLLQHAYNPVDWFPWGDEAFEKAKQENKPIFLSIGYSTCHWCHVMKRESFEDEEVANELNNHYVPIKVDREERPDIDGVYMTVCQMMNGQGGWPLTIFMTPDKVPFYAAMYLPKTSRYGMPGMMDALPQLRQKYHEEGDHIAEVTRSVTDALDRNITSNQDQQLTQKGADGAFKQLQQEFDSQNGGFGSAPKFPQPQQLSFLLRYHYFTGNQAALDMTETTLQQMAAGGIYDHIGFGFARYATDETWLVPHFEKMLHDNALLVNAYTEGFQATHHPWYRQKTDEIIQFIEREMTSEDGAFYSAIDAETEGEEGKYYVWDYNEIMDVLGNDLGGLYADVFNITEQGNFSGRNIPNMLQTDFDAVAQKHGLDTDTLSEKMETARKQLLAEREKRIYPHVDDKILTSWNAMMIAGLAKAGKAFDQPEYIKAAEKTADFIETNMFVEGRLMARYRDGETKYKGYIDDYAFLLWAYVELYDATYDMRHLQHAKQILDDMLDLFWDTDDGGFYFTGSDAETLISREKAIVEGALPSGNSTAAVMLVHMAYLTGDTTYLDHVEAMHKAFYKAIDLSPAAGSFFLQSVLLMENPTKEVVILGNGSISDQDKLTANLQQTFLPDVHVLTADEPGQFKGTADFAADYTPIGDDTTVYICENFACRAPETDVDQAFRLITGSQTS